MSGITCCGTCLFAKIASRLSLFPGLPQSVFGETAFKQWFRLMLILSAIYWICSSTGNQLNASAQAQIMMDNPDMMIDMSNPHWKPYISGEISIRMHHGDALDIQVCIFCILATICEWPYLQRTVADDSVHREAPPPLQATRRSYSTNIMLRPPLPLSPPRPLPPLTSLLRIRSYRITII
jgi:hypothetical protein